VTLGLFSSSILSFPDTLIGPATAYNYRAETEIGRWVSVPSSVVTVVTPSAAAWQTGTDDFLSAPTSLAGSAQYNPTLGAVLTWTPSTSGASGYDIYRADMAGSVYAYVNGGASSTYTDPYVLLNGSYTYTVAAVGTSGGVSVPSASVTVNLTLPPPAAPIVSHILTTSATFSWNQVASATSYTLSGAGAGCTTSSTACSVFGLTPGTQYTVSLVATNGSQTSPSSPTVTFTTLQQPVEVSFSCNGSSSCTNAGSAQTWTVPAGVTSISTVVGGGGGGGGSGEGGPGATVSGTMAVTPGEILSIYVGQTGQVDGSGGWGYHSGGSSMFLLSYLGSGSAGGSSAVVAGSTLVAEAGGGGGYAYGTTGGVAVGGSGGQPTATSGGAGSFYNSNYGGWGYAYGGAGATQSAGGAGGSYSGPCNVCAYGYSGSFGGTATSQNGANSTSAGVAGNWPTYGAQSGSGGGGYAGGGSGGVIGLPAAYDNAGGAGGGGSSWYSPSYMSGVSYGVGAGWAGGVTITYTP
jgi:hypothetical protein